MPSRTLPSPSVPGAAAADAHGALAGVLGGRSAALLGSLAMVCVGGSVAVSGTLDDAPLPTVQAIRYLLAWLILLGLARLTGRVVVRPRGREWWWLIGVAGSGLVLFNVALIRGGQHAEPAVIAVAVACVPVLLALLGPLLVRHRPRLPVLLGAAVVTLGTVVVSGFGRTDAIGVGWAVVVLGCEAGFTLLAVPLLVRHGAWGVSVHSTGLAALGFAGWAVVADGPLAVLELTPTTWAAVAYLAVFVTAIAFVLWYSAVRALGPGRAGLLTGVAPLAAAAVGVALGEPLPGPAVWMGLAVVGVGLAIGLRSGADRPAAPG
jgi:drug/metabolite transporter (DMT)-like permease